MIAGSGLPNLMWTILGSVSGDGYVMSLLIVTGGVIIFARQSYGGFMASKIVEANEGVHSLSMAVAVSLEHVSYNIELTLLLVACHQLASLR